MDRVSSREITVLSRKNQIYFSGRKSFEMAPCERYNKGVRCKGDLVNETLDMGKLDSRQLAYDRAVYI
jgi:hypothetical protein